MLKTKKKRTLSLIKLLLAVIKKGVKALHKLDNITNQKVKR